MRFESVSVEDADSAEAIADERSWSAIEVILSLVVSPVPLILKVRTRQSDYLYIARQKLWRVFQPVYNSSKNLPALFFRFAS